MEVKLVNYTPDGYNLIGELAKGSRKDFMEYNSLDAIVSDETYGIKVKDTQKLFENKQFVKWLIDIGHHSTLEYVDFIFIVTDVSRVTTHQLVRHRMASYTQMSSRHVKPSSGGFIEPHTIEDWSGKPHGRGHINARSIYLRSLANSFKSYKKLIDLGIPIEDARYMLPPAFFTNIAFKMNARSLRNFLELRLDKHAQWEIRELACKVFDLVYNIYPVLLEDLLPLRKENQ